MKRKYFQKTILCFGLVMMFSAKARADISIIVNPSNGVSLSQEEIKNIFLSKKNRFPNNEPAKPVDQQDSRPIRKEFYSKLVGMDDNDLRAYWSVLIFTGNASPPKVMNDDEAVKTFIKNNPAGLGYIDSKSVDVSIKVVFTIK
jgi:ABC-type phosphate transport system substrate-binding protein